MQSTSTLSESPPPLRPIRDDQEHARLLAEVERLWGAPAGSSDDDRLQVLVLLIDAYEQGRHTIAAADPAEAIRFRMEQRGLTVTALARLLNVRSRRVSEILEGHPPSLSMIRLLVERLDIPADVLIRGPEQFNEQLRMRDSV